GAVLHTADASAPGQPVLIQATSTGAGGQFSFDVTALAGLGDYHLDAVLNAVWEGEFAGGSNNSPATAQALDASAVALGGGADRLAAVGTTDAAADYYAFTLAAGQHATLVLGNQGAGTLDLQVKGAGDNLIALGESGTNDVNQQ